MHLLSFCAAALFAAAPLSAAPVRPAMHALNAEERLVVWLASNPSVRQKLGHIQAVAAPFADPSLKDAVADQPAIVKAAPRIGCRNLASCAVAPVSMDVPAGAAVEPAIRALLRPWIWLAEARGARLGIAPAAGAETLLAINLKGIAGAGLNIRPNPEGGYHLWFSNGLELGVTYARERGAFQTRRT